MDRLSIDFLTALGLPPVEFVSLAVELGVRRISLSPQPMVSVPGQHAEWSLLENEQLQRELSKAMADTGVAIVMSDFIVMPGMELPVLAPTLDVMAGLGVPLANIALIESDRTQAFDQAAVFAEMARARGMASTLEVLPLGAIKDIGTALAALRHVGDPDFRLTLDMLHLARSGAGTADLAALEPDQIGHIQICDAPLAWTLESYADEASNNRLCPGEGELPLLEWLRVLPGNVGVGLEVPMLAKAVAGVGPKARIAPCIAAGRALLEQASR
jgi:sugar phosphate isomerase/epimerase